MSPKIVFKAQLFQKSYQLEDYKGSRCSKKISRLILLQRARYCRRQITIELLITEVRECIRVDDELHVMFIFTTFSAPLPQWF